MGTLQSSPTRDKVWVYGTLQCEVEEEENQIGYQITKVPAVSWVLMARVVGQPTHRKGMGPW